MFSLRKISFTLLLIFSLSSLALFIGVPNVSAACNDKGCSNCKNPKLDLGCQRERLLDPNSAASKSCVLYYCADNGNQPATKANDISFNVFGVSIHINSDAGITALLFLIFNLFLGIVATALVVIGIRAAYRRGKAESDDEVAAAGKTIQNSAVGLAIIILSLLIAQLVASFLGVGSIAQLVSFSVIGN